MVNSPSNEIWSNYPTFLYLRACIFVLVNIVELPIEEKAYLVVMAIANENTEESR